MSSSNRPSKADQQEDEDALLDAEEAGEEIASAEEDDVPMDSDPEDNDDALQTEIDLQNDSIAHFDAHTDSIFSIAAHPLDPNIVATGSGDDSAYVFSTAAASAPSSPLPTSRILALNAPPSLPSHNSPATLTPSPPWPSPYPQARSF